MKHRILTILVNFIFDKGCISRIYKYTSNLKNEDLVWMCTRGIKRHSPSTEFAVGQVQFKTTHGCHYKLEMAEGFFVVVVLNSNNTKLWLI